MFKKLVVLFYLIFPPKPFLEIIEIKKSRFTKWKPVIISYNNIVEYGLFVKGIPLVDICNLVNTNFKNRRFTYVGYLAFIRLFGKSYTDFYNEKINTDSFKVVDVVILWLYILETKKIPIPIETKEKVAKNILLEYLGQDWDFNIEIKVCDEIFKRYLQSYLENTTKKYSRIDNGNNMSTRKAHQLLCDWNLMVSRLSMLYGKLSANKHIMSVDIEIDMDCHEVLSKKISVLFRLLNIE